MIRNTQRPEGIVSWRKPRSRNSRKQLSVLSLLFAISSTLSHCRTMYSLSFGASTSHEVERIILCAETADKAANEAFIQDQLMKDSEVLFFEAEGDGSLQQDCYPHFKTEKGLCSYNADF